MTDIKILKNNEEFNNELNEFTININKLNDINKKYLGKKNSAK